MHVVRMVALPQDKSCLQVDSGRLGLCSTTITIQDRMKGRYEGAAQGAVRGKTTGAQEQQAAFFLSPPAGVWPTRSVLPP